MGRKEKAELCYKRGKRQSSLSTCYIEIGSEPTSGCPSLQSTLIVHIHVRAINFRKNKCVCDLLSVLTDASS